MNRTKLIFLFSIASSFYGYFSLNDPLFSLSLSSCQKKIPNMWITCRNRNLFDSVMSVGYSNKIPLWPWYASKAENYVELMCFDFRTMETFLY